jgi:hypothetical protein
MRPPALCTASVLPAGHLGVRVDARLVPKAELPSMAMVASAMSRPALARWA